MTEGVTSFESETKKKQLIATINEKCGIHTEAKGLIMALPVDTALGMRKETTEE